MGKLLTSPIPDFMKDHQKFSGLDSPGVMRCQLYREVETCWLAAFNIHNHRNNLKYLIKQ